MIPIHKYNMATIILLVLFYFATTTDGFLDYTTRTKDTINRIDDSFLRKNQQNSHENRDTTTRHIKDRSIDDRFVSNKNNFNNLDNRLKSNEFLDRNNNVITNRQRILNRSSTRNTDKRYFRLSGRSLSYDVSTRLANRNREISSIDSRSSCPTPNRCITRQYSRETRTKNDRKLDESDFSRRQNPFERAQANKSSRIRQISSKNEENLQESRLFKDRNTETGRSRRQEQNIDLNRNIERRLNEVQRINSERRSSIKTVTDLEHSQESSRNYRTSAIDSTKRISDLNRNIERRESEMQRISFGRSTRTVIDLDNSKRRAINSRTFSRDSTQRISDLNKNVERRQNEIQRINFDRRRSTRTVTDLENSQENSERRTINSRAFATQQISALNKNMERRQNEVQKINFDRRRSTRTVTDLENSQENSERRTINSRTFARDSTQRSSDFNKNLERRQNELQRISFDRRRSTRSITDVENAHETSERRTITSRSFARESTQRISDLNKNLERRQNEVQRISFDRRSSRRSIPDLENTHENSERRTINSRDSTQRNSDLNKNMERRQNEVQRITFDRRRSTRSITDLENGHENSERRTINSRTFARDSTQRSSDLNKNVERRQNDVQRSSFDRRRSTRSVIDLENSQEDSRRMSTYDRNADNLNPRYHRDITRLANTVTVSRRTARTSQNDRITENRRENIRQIDDRSSIFDTNMHASRRIVNPNQRRISDEISRNVVLSRRAPSDARHTNSRITAETSNISRRSSSSNGETTPANNYNRRQGKSDDINIQRNGFEKSRSFDDRIRIIENSRKSESGSSKNNRINSRNPGRISNANTFEGFSSQKTRTFDDRKIQVSRIDENSRLNNDRINNIRDSRQGANTNAAERINIQRTRSFDNRNQIIENSRVQVSRIDENSRLNNDRINRIRDSRQGSNINAAERINIQRTRSFDDRNRITIDSRLQNDRMNNFKDSRRNIFKEVDNRKARSSNIVNKLRLNSRSRESRTVEQPRAITDRIINSRDSRFESRRARSFNNANRLGEYSRSRENRIDDTASIREDRLTNSRNSIFESERVRSSNVANRLDKYSRSRENRIDKRSTILTDRITNLRNSRFGLDRIRSLDDKNVRAIENSRIQNRINSWRQNPETVQNVERSRYSPTSQQKDSIRRENRNSIERRISFTNSRQRSIVRSNLNQNTIDASRIEFASSRRQVPMQNRRIDNIAVEMSSNRRSSIENSNNFEPRVTDNKHIMTTARLSRGNADFRDRNVRKMVNEFPRENRIVEKRAVDRFVSTEWPKYENLRKNNFKNTLQEHEAYSTWLNIVKIILLSMSFAQILHKSNPKKFGLKNLVSFLCIAKKEKIY